jgi:hypothetical protein
VEISIDRIDNIAFRTAANTLTKFKVAMLKIMRKLTGNLNLKKESLFDLVLI